MKIKRKMQIEVRQNKILFIDEGMAAAFVECPVCGSQGKMLSAGQAMHLSGLTSREIHRLADSGRLHFQETAAGALLVCSASLSAVREEEQ